MNTEPLDYASMTDEEKRKHYDARLTALKEQVKLNLLTQDSFDRAQRLLSRQIFGKPEDGKEYE